MDGFKLPSETGLGVETDSGALFSKPIADGGQIKGRLDDLNSLKRVA